jgi:hypothetical protein
VTRYLSIVLGRLEARFEWTTRASIEMKQRSDAYQGLKRRAELALTAEAYDDLLIDLDDHWCEPSATHATASALILDRLR